MNGVEFIEAVIRFFGGFLEDLGFENQETEYSGKLYDVTFARTGNRLSVSYEPGEEYLLILLFEELNGKLSDIDDRSRTLRLSDLTRRYLPGVDRDAIEENNRYFEGFMTRTVLEKRLLKAAKDLRLCLRKGKLGWRTD